MPSRIDSPTTLQLDSSQPLTDGAEPWRPAGAPEPASNTIEVHERSGEAAPSSGGDALPSGSFSTRLPTADSVRQELDQLFSGVLGGVLHRSEEDVRRAVGDLNSLRPDEYRGLFEELTRDGTLEKLVEALPEDTRPALLQQAVLNGVLSERRGLEAQPSETKVRPPAQPDLLKDDERLPPALRGLIHATNRNRASEYTSAFKQYVEAYCTAASQASTPLELRALGPLSTPPALYQAMASGKAGQELTQVNVGIERAARAVSDRVSDLRGERHAGSYGLEFEVTGKMELGPYAGSVGVRGSLDQHGHVEETVTRRQGLSLTREEVGALEVMRTSDGRPALDLEAGQLIASAVSAGLLHHAGVEYEEGRLTLSATAAGAPVGAYSFVDSDRAQYGGGLEVDEEVGISHAKAKLTARIGVNAQGIPREYYQDIGGAQNEGLFGAMPELEQRTPWGQIPQVRQGELSRQGFTAKWWPF